MPRVAVLCAALLAGAAPAARAQDWRQLVMPGDVIEGHANLEADCSNCHKPFQKLEQRSLCLACHDHSDVAKDIRSRVGYHGRSRAVDAECSTCHTEHVGREADIVGLDEATFDHAQTDFELDGLHRTTPCAGCHEPDKRYREATSTCVSCHGDGDPHEGRLGEDCADCHTTAGWKTAKFDHDKTDFPLTGKHDSVACASCHPSEQYENTPKDCASCHRVNDVHTGRFGHDCSTCHSSEGWKRVSFDHDKTDFPLRGAHASAGCETCHESDAYKTKLPTDCYSCHRAADEHKGRFGTKCETCHSVHSWSDEEFDHGATEFPLRGAHEKVACIACHTGVLDEVTLGTTCQTCHLDDDPHDGQQGKKCGDCHRETGWTSHVFFDHGLTRFPLLGLHAVAACEECHTTKQFRDAPERCTECHPNDDFHERRLGTSCDRCHNPNGWSFWRFDHDTQTDFALDGAHAELRCRNCHTHPVKEHVSLSQECGACHDDDDVHLGSYGRDCGRCHETSRWDRVSHDR